MHVCARGVGGVTWEHSAQSSQLIRKSETALKLVTFKNVTENDGMAPLECVATEGLWERMSKMKLRDKKQAAGPRAACSRQRTQDTQGPREGPEGKEVGQLKRSQGEKLVESNRRSQGE